MKQTNMSTLRICAHLLAITSILAVLNSAQATTQVTAEPLAALPYIFNPFTAPDWIGEANLDEANFGAAVASAGDVNGDGYDDVIVGAPYVRNGQEYEGRAYIFHGSATGLKPLPAWTFESNITQCELGWTAATAGDVNGDGYDDVLVGSPFCNVPNHTGTREGRVYLFMGSAAGVLSTPAKIIDGDGPEESLGQSAAAAGDVNGDGYDDVIIGAPWASYSEGHEGRAYVYHGSATGIGDEPDWTMESNIAWSDFGASVAGAGDINIDGYDDVIIGQPNFGNPESSEGGASIYYGSATGLKLIPDWTFESNRNLAMFGEAVSSAGDVNGDGRGDIIVGAFGYTNSENNEGAAYLFLNSVTGLATTPAWKVESNAANSQYGQSVAAAGDVNMDGYGDVLVGAPRFNSGQTLEGKVFLYFGSPTGLRPAPVYTTESNQPEAVMGYSAASAGEVNGDGISDIILGAQLYDGGQGNEGRAFAYYGIHDAVAEIFLPVTRR